MRQTARQAHRYLRQTARQAQRYLRQVRDRQRDRHADISERCETDSETGLTDILGDRQRDRHTDILDRCETDSKTGTHIS
jgi:hypothetical protein